MRGTESKSSDQGASQSGTFEASHASTVLLVEDDEALARTFVATLPDGYDVVAVPSVEAALSRLRSGEPFDAIVLDQGTARAPARELLAKFFAVHPALASRVAFLTDGEGRGFLEGLPNLYLDKPLQLAQLRGFVDDVSHAAILRDPRPRELHRIATLLARSRNKQP